MAKEKIPFEDFLLVVEPALLPFVRELHEWFLEKGCTVKIESSKSGYVVSYGFGGKVLMNYVMRKQGLMVRLYADHVAGYRQLVEALPEAVKKQVAKASICRRLHDPAKCNARCPMGYVFTIDGEEHKKCRYGAFLVLLDETSGPHIRGMLDAELAARAV